jgi:hypothetical protein
VHGLDFDNLLGVIDLREARDDRPDAAAASRPSALEEGAMRAAGWLVGAAAVLLLVLAARRFGAAFLGGRLAVLLLTLSAASAIVFCIVQVVPGDPVRYMMGLQADPGRWPRCATIWVGCAAAAALSRMGGRPAARRFRFELHLPRSRSRH